MNPKVISVFEENAPRYDQWFERHPAVFESEVTAIRQVMQTLPENIHGIEIGVGTGRFAERLGIREGVEPAEAMREIAARRGIEVINGFAEHLPYRDLHFDFVLFVTICYLDNVKEAFIEANRVLKKGGAVIVGFIDRDSSIGQAYLRNQKKEIFYRHADFFSIDRVKSLLKDTGFRNPEFIQTLFGPSLEVIEEWQSPKEGYGEGAFVVVKAVKP